MEINLTAYLLFMGCSAAACILWFFLAARKQMPAAKAGALSALTLLLGILLGTAGASWSGSSAGSTPGRSSSP